MITKGAIALAMSGCMLVATLTGCGANTAVSSSPTASSANGPSDAATISVNKEGFPIVNESITLKVFGQQGPVQSKWDDMSMWKHYQEKLSGKIQY